MPMLRWDDAKLAAVAEQVAAACRAWHRDWSLHGGPDDGAPVDVEPVSCCADSFAGAGLAVFALDAQDAAGEQVVRAWLGCMPQPGGTRSPELAGLVAARVFGAEPGTDGGDIAAELSQAALAGLIQALRAVLGLADLPGAGDAGLCHATLPREQFGYWSGALRVGLPGFDGLSLFLDAAAVARLTPVQQMAAALARPALTPLTFAAQSHIVDLQARLRGVELSIGQLKSLQVGDVVVLPHSLEEPLQIVTPAGETICQAYLGSDQGHRAIEVLPTRQAAA